MFSREVNPAKREQIPRPESALQWPHLKNIATLITPYQSDVEVGILMGSDCPRAIMLREVIPGEEGNPYTMRSDLGWGIVGRISQPLEEGDDEDEIGVSHRLHTCEVRNLPDPLEDATRHVRKTCNFSIKTQVKEVINPLQVIQMFETDFSERVADSHASVSQDDIAFLLNRRRTLPDAPTLSRKHTQAAKQEIVSPTTIAEASIPIEKRRDLSPILHRIQARHHRKRIRREGVTGTTTR